MSSRLVQEVREKRAMAYSVSTGFSAYRDLGLFDIFVGTRPEVLHPCISLLKDEIQRLLDRSLTGEEIAEAKQMIRGSLLLAEDDSDERMMSLGLAEMRFKRYIDIDEALDRVDAVTIDAVRDWVQKHLIWEKMHLSILGRVDGFDQNKFGSDETAKVAKD